MLRAIQLLGIACLVIGCTEISSSPTETDAQNPTSLPAFKSTDKGSIAHTELTADSCKSACWRDVPFNACRRQRNHCLKHKKTAAGKLHCREMSRTCRKVRNDCLEACETNTPQNDPLALEPADPDEPGVEDEEALEARPTHATAH